MARKEKGKSKKSPDKSPRRVGRPGRRRKKSDSESSEDKKSLESTEQPEQGESSEGGRMRRSTRRQVEVEPKPTQSSEWKEDESFWSKDGGDNNKEGEASKETGEGGTLWKVQTSNGSGGEIQKLRICRQRPAGAGSDSAESSMSPAKDSSSPLHKSKGKREAQKSPLVESSVCEIELPPSEIELPPSDETSTIELPPSQPSEITLPPIAPTHSSSTTVTKVIENSTKVAKKLSPQPIEEGKLSSIPGEMDQSATHTQDTVTCTEELDEKQRKDIEETEAAVRSLEAEIQSEEPPVIIKSTLVVESSVPEEKGSHDLPHKTKSTELLDAGKHSIEETKEETVELTLTSSPIDEQTLEEKENPENDKPKAAAAEEIKKTEDTEKLKNSEDSDKQKKSEDSEKLKSEDAEKRRKSVDTEKRRKSDDVEKRKISVERRISIDSEKPKSEAVEGDDKKSGADKSAEGVNSRRNSQVSTTESRRKSDASVKSGGSRRGSVSGPSSAANSESNEPLLEISADKSPIPEGKEEGEIVDDDKPETPPKESRRIVKLRSGPDEKTPGRILINRRSTGDSQTSPDKSGSASTAATTAKRHPLITGPEPDESPAVRRRKLSASLGATTRTVITPGGTTRQVRSIPGEALKALIPLPTVDAEKKEKEKQARVKMIKVKIEKPDDDSGGGAVTKISSESRVGKVEDVRELLKNNRSKKSDKEKENRPSKSLALPTKTVSNNEVKVKAPTRKVSIGGNVSTGKTLVEEVKSVKPARSKSPGDSKASPILFITNLVRPFTAGQLKELLARTGTIAPNGFFIDKIKSKCFVMYVDVEMAIETRHALNGVKWPVSNPKVLKVSYASEKELKAIQESADGEIVDDICAPRSGWLSEQAVMKDREKRKTSAPATREWDKGKPKSVSDGDVIFVEEYKKEEKHRQAILGHPPGEFDRNERYHDKPPREEHPRNHSLTDRRKRRPSVELELSPPPQARKFKKKDYDAPAKLLDDLFRKTQTTPCLYWLPLSAEQIAVKEENRRKHMAEHERQMAELKRSAQQRREKERDRDRRRR